MAIKKINKWEITTERFVAYIDIMGFKDMVSRLSHEEIYTMMKRIDETKRLIEKVGWTGKSNYVSTTNYSDSIMIYSKDSSSESIHSFVCSVAAMTDDLFKAGIPHKGAFAFGTMTLDTINSIFFGQPLIDAYLLQEEMHFYGIAGHASAEKKLALTWEKEALIEKFPCFFKNGISEHLTIFPIYAGFSKDHKEFGKEQIALLKSVEKLRHTTSGSLRKYIDNTEAYLNSICSKINPR